jgi:hypothetical protein
MSLLDLSLVSRALIRLLEAHVGGSSAWSSSVTLNVTPQPPDVLTGEHTLGLYLYHVSEDPSRRNEGLMNLDVPVRYQPMPLALHFQLTAHSDIEGADGTYQEQLMFGLALKALHDYPVLNDDTVVNGTTVFPPELIGGDNRIRIDLQQIEPAESRSYWNSDEKSVRLSAYYRVSVMLLEPEEPQRRPGRVLAPGVQVFLMGAPRLDTSSTTLTLTIPGEDPADIVVSPAQVPVGEVVTFSGSGLAGGALALLLDNANWSDAPIVVDATTWTVVSTSTTVSATVQEQADATHDVVPGIYGALARLTVTRTMPDGTSRDFDHLSNESPFAILPRIDAMSAPDATGVFDITGYVFQHADLDPADVIVYVSDARLAAGTAGALAAGEYAITAADTIEARLPTGLTPGDDVPVRVFVNNAESLPTWVTVP